MSLDYPGGAEVKVSACNVGDLGSIPGSGRFPGKGDLPARYSSILAWRIPWMEELGGLQFVGRKESDTTERLHFYFHFSYHQIKEFLESQNGQFISHSNYRDF